MFPGGLNKLPTAPKLPTTPAMETLGEMSPEFTAVGGESMYNMGRPSPKTFADPAYEAYMRLFAKGGR